MTQKYYAILTNQGAARLANAAALGTKLNLTQMGVGDANGVLPVPDPAQTKLINQWRIAALNQLSVDPKNPGQIIAEQIIPEDEGGKWIREIGLYDDEGVLIAVANCPETYKPLLQEGSGRTQTIRMILIVSSAAAITLKIDPSVVLATRKYVDDAVIEVKAYADNLVKAHEKKANPHSQYPLIKNALKEMAEEGLADEIIKNLGLGTAVKKDVGTGAGQLPSMTSFTTNFDGGSAYQINWPSNVAGKNGKGLQLQSALVNLSPGYQVVTLPFAVPTQAIFCDVSVDAGSANPGATVGAGLSDFNKIRLVNFGSTGATVRYYCWCV